MEKFVIEAIADLNEEEGSTAYQIFSHIKANKNAMPNSRTHNLLIHVRRSILRSLNSNMISESNRKYKIVSRVNEHKDDSDSDGFDVSKHGVSSYSSISSFSDGGNAKKMRKQIDEPLLMEPEKKQSSQRKSLLKMKSSARSVKARASQTSRKSVNLNKPSSIRISSPPEMPQDKMDFYVS